MANSPTYDYIIAGAGCAGLSLILHLMESGKFTDKRILLIDRQRERSNDRTWCFWEKEPGMFEEIVYARWSRAWFHEGYFSRLLQLEPFEYKLIRGVDFYEYCFEKIRRQPNIEIHYGRIEEIRDAGDRAVVIVGDSQFDASYVFNSVFLQPPVLAKDEYHLRQHFKGWIVETEAPVFEPSEATLMDFRVGQEHGTAFVYVMPFTVTKALVEYTLFTRELLASEQYEAGLRDYLQRIVGKAGYRVLEEENGEIPMTNHRFPTSRGRIIYTGSAGGQTKASSGYTFRFIQKHAAAIVAELAKGDGNFIPPRMNAKRFRFYDSVLLDILYHDRLPGKDIFRDLFQKNKPQSVLRFLDNESSFHDEWNIITSLPAWPFLKAAWRQR